MIELNDHTLKIPTIASGSDKKYWLIIKQMIFNKFENFNIKLIIYNGHNSSTTLKHELRLQIMYTLNENQLHDQTTKTHQLNGTHINKQNIYRNSKPGDNIHADGNSGIYALYNAIKNSYENKITFIVNLLNILELQKLLYGV